MPPSPPAPLANPLLLEWVKEIYDIAQERNSKGATTYKKAYKSMKACPITFNHPSEAIQLDGIGPKICDRLTEKLKEHCLANGLPAPKKPRGKDPKRLGAEDLAQDEEPPPPKRLRKTKPYVPNPRTGPWAIIMALSSLPEHSLQSLSKAELIDLAQPYCDSSFSVPSEPGKFYTAWNSTKTLVEKDIVQEKGRPLRKYNLTEDGWDVARRMRTVEKGDVSKPFENVAQPEPTTTEAAATKSKPKPRKVKLIENLDDLSDWETIKPPPVRLEQSNSMEIASLSSSTGQRLGGAPVDKFGTIQKRRDEPKPKPKPKPKPTPPSNFVELLSSPEPPRRPSVSTTAGNRASQPLSAISGNSSPEARRKPLKAQPQPKHSTSVDPPPSTITNLSSSSLPTFTPITLPPGSFSIRLVLDNREVRAKDDRDYISRHLTTLGHTPLVRPLPLGDVFWVAIPNDPSILSAKGEGSATEIALDWIVERKRLDDLVGSITDGRLAEQKFRLRRSGARHVVYLIEEITLSQEKATRFGDAITSAIASTQVVNGYFVKQTKGLDASIRYLARLTTMLKARYETRPLHVIPTHVLTPTNYLPLLAHLETADPAGKCHNITFPAFASLASKNDTLTLRDVFLKMLMCTRGISGDKALAIQKAWPTPRAFMDALGGCATDGEREGMVEGRLGGLIGKGKIKGVLGRKVAEVWGLE